MTDASFLAAFAIWSVGPGLLTLWALGSRWSGIERLAAAGGLSIAIVSAASYAATAIGLPVTPIAAGTLIVTACALLALARRRWPAKAGGADPADHAWCPAPRPTWIPWLVLCAPAVVVWQLEPLWSSGILVPPTLYDGLDHANWFRLILETRSVAPSVVMAPPLNPDGTATFYPWGLHAWLALMAGSTTLDPMTTFWRGLIGMSALVPLSVFAFAARFTGRGWPAVAAAALSLVFWWIPYQAWGWGGYALLGGAVAALPVSRLALDASRADDRVAFLAAAAAGAGLLLVHPSQAMSALLICVVVTVTFAAGAAGRWRAAVPFLAVLGVVFVALALASSAWAPLESFLERARTVGDTLAGDPRYAWPGAVYAGMIWHLPDSGRVVLTVLYAVGALVSLRHAELRPIVVLHLVFSLMIPMADRQAWLTAFWYHAPERIWYLQYACLPVLGALGLAGVFQFVDGLLRGRGALLSRQAVLWPLVLVAFLGGVEDDYTERADNFVGFFGYRARPIIPTDPGLLADFAWIESNVPAGEVLFNASADWGLSLPFTGHRTVFWSGGYAIDPTRTWHQYQEQLNRGDPHSSFAARELARLGVRYVYAAVVDPRLAIEGREPLSIGALQDTASLEPLHVSSTGAVFRVIDTRSVPLGLLDSDRLHFHDGFWGTETSGGQTWRWTNGHGRFKILPGSSPVAACAVRFLGPDPEDYEVTANGLPLELTPAGHRLPEGIPADRPIEIAILSPAVASGGGGSDERRLGVQVYDSALVCG